MESLELYFFENGQSVPGWLYLVQNAGEDVPCTFGTNGYCVVDVDGSVVIWPGVDRLPEEYIFSIENTYLNNATVCHPKGDELLQVLGNESLARDRFGVEIDRGSTPLPENDPRSTD